MIADQVRSLSTSVVVIQQRLLLGICGTLAQRGMLIYLPLVSGKSLDEIKLRFQLVDRSIDEQVVSNGSR